MCHIEEPPDILQLELEQVYPQIYEYSAVRPSIPADFAVYILAIAFLTSASVIGVSSLFSSSWMIFGMVILSKKGTLH